MADVKIFNSAAVSHTATVSEGAIVVSSTEGNLVLPSNLGELELSVNTQNLGEENVPDPTKYKRIIDVLSINVGQINITLNKTLGSTELLTTSELSSRIVGKNLLDQTNYIAELLAKDLSIVLVDIADATDDFYGLANIDDDQIATFNKVLSDYTAGSTELSYYSFDKVINTTSYLNDGTRFSIVDKVLTTTFNVPDQLSRVITFIRSFQHSIASSDSLLKVVDKGVSDLATTANLITKIVNLGKLDQTLTSDVFARTVLYNRDFIDTVDATDDFYGLANIDDDQIASIGKVLATVTNIANSDQIINEANFIRSFASSTNSIVDTFNKLLEPNKFDGVGISEFNIITINQAHNLQVLLAEQNEKLLAKTFSDVFDATDDFLGNANIDDDQIAFVGKNLISNLSGVTEFSLADYTKPFTDQTALLETTSLLFDKPIIADQTLLSDQVINTLEKPILSTLSSTVDVDSKSYTKILFDQNTNITELFEQTIGKNPEDIAYIAETYRLFNIDVVLLDQIITQDEPSYLKQTLWNAFDQLDATDDFYGLANIDDDQIASFTKVLASSTTGAVDFSTRQIQPNKVDNVATTESRSAHIQDYFLDEYVGYTQRYVGTTVTI